MLIIPAIDILDGECVRLTQGDYERKKVYASDPVLIAKKFEKDGADFLHIVDLDASKTGNPINFKKILEIRQSVDVPIEVGGGIRDYAIAKKYLDIGINSVVLGTKAFDDLDFVKRLVDEFGSDAIIVAMDVLDGTLRASGWLKDTKKGYLDFANQLNDVGVRRIIFTDISRDGMMNGPNFDAILELMGLGFDVIASGGIADMQNISVLKELNVYGAIIGKAIYEGKLSIMDFDTDKFAKSGLTKRIIPCLDVKDGRVVKGVNFENLRDCGDPVELAKYYYEQGADELVFLDITATNEKRATMIDLVSKVSKQVFVPLTVGGGIGSTEQARAILAAGADKVAVNSAACKDPTLISKLARAFGSQAVVVAIDVKKIDGRYMVFVNAGTEATGIDLIDWVKTVVMLGAGELLVTSMDQDGVQNGFDDDLYALLDNEVNIPVIASGGAGSLQDVASVFVNGRADAALLASTLHDKKIMLPCLKQYLIENNLNLRI